VREPIAGRRSGSAWQFYEQKAAASYRVVLFMQWLILAQSLSPCFTASTR